MREASHLILDTHAWLWLVWQDKRIEPALSAISAAAGKDRLRVSIFSMWEIALLDAKRRIELEMECREWIQDSLTMPGFGLIALSPEICIDSTRLPGRFHDDPADRIIVASARYTSATIVTKDERIIRYSEQGFVKVLAL